MARKIYKEEIDMYGSNSVGCLPKSSQKHIDPDTQTLNLHSWAQENENDHLNFVNKLSLCNDAFYSDNNDTSGCCLTLNDQAHSTESCKTSKHETGLMFLGGRGGLETVKVCHKSQIQEINNTLLNDTNNIVKFFKLIFVSIITLLITAIIGTCYEFWCRYGESKECIYYKSKCGNIGADKEISLIDYMFPNNISYYPYQACSKSNSQQIGGTNKDEGIISNFVTYNHTGRKCITLDYNNNTIYGGKPIPYNIVELVEFNISNKYILVLAKIISYFFLFPVLFVRIVLNYLFKTISKKYQNRIKFNPLSSNIFFIILTGLIGPLLTYITGNSRFTYGPLLLITFLITIVSFIMTCAPLLTLGITIAPETLIGPYLRKYNLDPSRYRLLSWKLLYSISNEPLLKNKIKNIIYNILLIVFVFLPFAMISVTLALIMSLISNIYMNLSLLLNIFYIPLSNPYECFDILKSHADLLTILFCVGVLGSAKESLDGVTIGIMAGVLMIIIIYKAIKGTKNSFS